MAEGLAINPTRLQQDLADLAKIGRVDGVPGLHRLAFNPSETAAREWLTGRLCEIGLAVEIDGAANISSRWPRDVRAPCVMTGSHIDTVPGAGELDGAYGVVAGLEALRVLVENEVALRRPVELVVFSDEEGRFGGMFGSQAMSGQLTPGAIEAARDLAGVSLIDAMAEHGYEARNALNAERARGSIHSFVELHIEQGPVLEREQRAIGLVEAITGLFRWEIRIQGEPNHAGTTPMDLRRDAFQGLVEFAGRIDELLVETGGPHSRATIGRVELVPGAANVVPGEARLSLEVRDTDSVRLANLGDAFRRCLSEIVRRRNLSFDFEVVSEIEPVACHERVLAAIEKACVHLGIEPFPMPSGAAHDTQMLTRIAPAAMIFVPSRGGRSHSPAEWTAPVDIEQGANVLLHTLLELARS